MPALATFFASLLGTLSTWLFGQFSKRVASSLTLLTLAVTFGVAAWAMITQCSACTSISSPSLAFASSVGGSFGTVLSWCIPDNLFACISCILATEVAIGTYRFAKLSYFGTGS